MSRSQAPGAVVRDERGDLRRRRRQAEQIEIRAAHERQPIGARRRRQPCAARAPVSRNRSIGLREILAVDRQRSLHRQLERPVATFLGVSGRMSTTADAPVAAGASTPPSHLAPSSIHCLQQRQLRRVERRRPASASPVARAQRPSGRAGSARRFPARAPGRARRRTIAALARAEVELRQLQRTAVARHALLLQDRSDVAVEGDGWLRGRLRREVRSAQEKGDADDP